MNQQQWRRVGSFAALVDEMDADPINIGFELSKAIERRFVCAPIIAMQPVVGNLFQIRQADPICPARSLSLIGPAGSGQALMQVVEGRLWNSDGECSSCDSFSFHQCGLLAERHITRILARVPVSGLIQDT
jgi:hypothetical protein